MRAIVLIAALATMQLDALDRAIELHVDGRIEEALAAYDQALDGLEDPIDRAVAQNNACLILVDLERYDEARERCLAAARQLDGSDQTALLADNRTNLALALQSLGDLEGALGALEEALALTLQQQDPELESMTRSNLGAVLTELGRFGEAAQQYRAVEQRAEASDGEEWALQQAAIARVNRAVLLFELGDARAALELLGERTRAALPEFGLEIGINRAVLLSRLGDPLRSLEVLDSLLPASGAEAAIRVNRAVAHRMLGNLDASVAEAEAAIAIAIEQKDQLEQMRASYQLARAREEQGEADAAWRSAETALELARESGSPEGSWSARTLLARLSHARGDRVTTDTHLTEALRLLETTRRTTPDLVLRATFQGSWRQVYETAHAIWVERATAGEPSALARAFDVVQRAKSRSLLDVLSADGGRARPRSLEDVRARLGESLLLEFFVGEGRTWRWSIRRDAARVEVVDDSGETAALARQLLVAVRSGDSATAIGDRLGSMLLPLDIDASALHVAPDGYLHELPFEVLRHRDAYLAETHALIYWPSGSFVGPAAAPDREPRFAALAAPRAPEQPPAGIGDALWQIWSTPLPEARAEIDAGAEALDLPTSSMDGATATEKAFWGLAAERRASVVHLAAHAVVDPEPGASAILLSPDESDDGVLRQQEIAARSLDVGLAVLAACRTVDLAGGRTGDALNSLTGAFLAAGAEAVMASRWEVPDAGSRVLMEQFYHYLGSGLTAAESLRAARGRLIAAGHADRPDVWAAYVMVGDARVTEPRSYESVFVALAIIALLVTGFVLRKATRRGLPSDAN